MADVEQRSTAKGRRGAPRRASAPSVRARVLLLALLLAQAAAQPATAGDLSDAWLWQEDPQDRPLHLDTHPEPATPPPARCGFGASRHKAPHRQPSAATPGTRP